MQITAGACVNNTKTQGIAALPYMSGKVSYVVYYGNSTAIIFFLELA